MIRCLVRVRYGVATITRQYRDIIGRLPSSKELLYENDLLFIKNTRYFEVTWLIIRIKILKKRTQMNEFLKQNKEI